MNTMERVPESASFEYLRARYLAEYTDREIIAAYSDQVVDNANDVFRLARPEAVWPLAVAAHQEPAEGILTALGTCNQALQDTTPYNPIVPEVAIVASLNAPEGQDASLDDAVEVMYEARQRYPRLPLSWLTTTYPSETNPDTDMPQTTIGRIKKDVYDTSLLVASAWYDHTPPRLAMLSEDADLRNWSPRFLGRLLGPIISDDYNVVRGRQRHERSFVPDPDRPGEFVQLFPNMDRVLYWLDLPIYLNPNTLHDCHTALAAMSYMRAAGIDPIDNIDDMINLQRRINCLAPPYTSLQVGGALAVTSPRRPYALMQDKKPPNGMSEYFTMHDTYRGQPVHSFRDISDELADDMIAHLGREVNFFGKGRFLFDAAKMGLASSYLAMRGQRYTYPYESQAINWAQQRVDHYRQVAGWLLNTT